MKVLLAATGEIALPTLQWLIKEHQNNQGKHQLLGVITGLDRKVGRGQKWEAPAMKTLALEHDIAVFQPPAISEIHDELAATEPDILLVMAYGQILKKDILELPRIACLNLHASLLPAHRGASPIQASILQGDSESGITVMHMAAGLDTGDILLQQSLTLNPQETGETLHDRLADLAPQTLEEALNQLTSGTATRTAQDHEAANYVGKLSRTDGIIDWGKSAQEIERQVRAFHPYPGTTSTLHNGSVQSTIKILPPLKVGNPATKYPKAGHIEIAESGEFNIHCDTGNLQLENIQPQGKRPMKVGDYLRGHPLEEGAYFA